MQKQHNKTTVYSILIALLLSSCLSSVSTKTSRKGYMASAMEARLLIDQAWKAQGFDNLSKYKTYEVVATDKWKGLAGKMGKVWPNAESKLNLKYDIGSFDGQVTFLDGKNEGLTAGLQSWVYYEKEKGSKANFLKKPNEKFTFGLSAYQYFFELIERLKNAPIAIMAGEREFKGKQYDLVFVTWEKIKKHKEHDQFLLWINKETKLLDYCEFTLHNAFTPGSAMIPGSIEFADHKNIDGVSIPFTQYVYIGKPKKKQKKYVHRITVDSFRFDSFDEKILYPNPEILKLGDSKK